MTPNLEMAHFHAQTGAALLGKGKLEKAKFELELALELNPSDHQSWCNLGLVALRLGHVASAVVHFDRAVNLQPNHAGYLADRAVARLRANDQAGAITDLTLSIKLNPENPYYWSLRAFARNAAGDGHGAIDDYREAIRLDPDDAIAYNNMGLVEEGLGYAGQAKKSFARADELAGIKPRPTENFIPMADERPALNPSTVQAQPKVHWTAFVRLMWQALTDKNERALFLKFLKNKGKI